MGIFDKLFGGGRDDADPLELAKGVLEKAASTAADQPEKALNLLRRESEALGEILGVGAPLHEALRETLLRIRSAGGESPPPAEAPTVKKVPWSAWEEPKLADLVREAEASPAEILYVADTRESHRAAPVDEIETLRALGGREDLALVVLGEANLFVRRGFLLDAGQSLDASSEEIVQDLVDHARAKGLAAE